MVGAFCATCTATVYPCFYCKIFDLKDCWYQNEALNYPVFQVKSFFSEAFKL